MNKRRILVTHLVIGVPLAALLHSILQFLFEAPFAVQAGLVIALGSLGVGRIAQIVAGAGLQALLVSIWAAFIGIEPSLAGRFRLTPPMVAAGALAGALTAWAATKPHA